MITDKLETIPEPTDSRYSCFDTGSLETEVGEFLYGLVRMVKPEKILETGSYHGISTSYMADALKKNGFGKLTTLEYEQINLNTTRIQLAEFGLLGFVNTEYVSSLNYQPKEQFDLIFLDTEPGIRFQELVKYYPFLKPGGFVFIHDLHEGMSQDGPTLNGMEKWPYGPLPEEIKNLVKDGELKPFYFRTPRGLTGLYKTGANDYKWI